MQNNNNNSMENGSCKSHIAHLILIRTNTMDFKLNQWANKSHMKAVEKVSHYHGFSPQARPS